MADLLKLFTYVDAAAESKFISTVINSPTVNTTEYWNRIVFLQGSQRIWVKGKYYGTDPKDLQAIYTLIGADSKATLATALGTYNTDTYKADDVIGIIKNVIKAFETYKSDVIGYGPIAEDGDDMVTWVGKEIAKARAAATTVVAVEGSGLSIKDETATDGHHTYTIVADQSIWEFCGEASATAATVGSVLDGKYGTGSDKKRAKAEVGDVWAVTITDQSNNVILYACSKVGTPNTWVQIGAAQGISGVDGTASHGVKLVNTASVVSVTVTPGSVASGNDSVVTGGLVYTAINTAYNNALTYAYNKAKTAYEDACGYAYSEAWRAYDAAVTYTNTKVTELEAAIDNNSYSVAADTRDSAYLAVTSQVVTGTGNKKVTAYTVSLDEDALHNYIVSNLWEEITSL